MREGMKTSRRFGMYSWHHGPFNPSFQLATCASFLRLIGKQKKIRPNHFSLLYPLCVKKPTFYFHATSYEQKTREKRENQRYLVVRIYASLDLSVEYQLHEFVLQRGDGPVERRSHASHIGTQVRTEVLYQSSVAYLKVQSVDVRRYVHVQQDIVLDLVE